MLFDFLLILGMSLLAFLTLILIKSKVSFTKKLLSVFLANAFLFLLYYYSYLHKIHITGAIAVLFAHGVGYLLGPSFFFMVKSLVFKKEVIIKAYKKSLIPFVLVFIGFNIPLSIAMTTDFLKDYHQFYLAIEIPFNVIENIFLTYYLIKSLKFIKKLKQSIKENYANLTLNKIAWYNHFALGFIFIVVVDSLFSIYESVFPMVPWNVGNIIAFSLLLLYLYLGYKGLFQAQIFIPSFLLNNLDDNNIKDKPKPLVKTTRQLHSFNDEEIDALKESLANLMDNEKVYLDEDLNLTDLADKIGISNKKLSELLNYHLKTNFYNLINEYRVNEVKRRIENGDTKKYTIISIANDAGFKSKASFYRIFKQRVGVSPSKYISKD